MTCAPFSTAILDYAFPSNAEEPPMVFVPLRPERTIRYAVAWRKDADLAPAAAEVLAEFRQTAAKGPFRVNPERRFADLPI